MKRKTPEDDVNRLAERIWQRGRGKIGNRDDFDAVFDSYLRQSGQGLSQKQKTQLREDTFVQVQKRHPGVSKKEGVDTGGRKELFKSMGVVPSAAEFSFLGYVGKRQVYLRRTKLKSGRPVYRDEKGRFGSIRTKTERVASVSGGRNVTYDPSTGRYVKNESIK